MGILRLVLGALILPGVGENAQVVRPAHSDSPRLHKQHRFISDNKQESCRVWSITGFALTSRGKFCEAPMCRRSEAWASVAIWLDAADGRQLCSCSAPLLENAQEGWRAQERKERQSHKERLGPGGRLHWLVTFWTERVVVVRLHQSAGTTLRALEWLQTIEAEESPTVLHTCVSERACVLL